MNIYIHKYINIDKYVYIYIYIYRWDAEPSDEGLPRRRPTLIKVDIYRCKRPEYGRARSFRQVLKRCTLTPIPKHLHGREFIDYKTSLTTHYDPLRWFWGN